MNRTVSLLLTAIIIIAIACQKEEKKEAAPSSSSAQQKAAEQPSAPVAEIDPSTLPVKPKRDPGTVTVEHILISYRGSKGPPRIRSKEEAKKLADDLLKQARAKGANFEALMKNHSDDKALPLTIFRDERGSYSRSFVQCAINLSPGNIDLVESEFGFHIVKRLK